MSPVAALWSILLVDIKTVMQIIATKTINAFGGFVMFTLGPSPQQVGTLWIGLIFLQ